MESRHKFRKKMQPIHAYDTGFFDAKNANSLYNIMVKISTLLQIFTRVSPKFHFLMLLFYPILSQKPMFIG